MAETTNVPDLEIQGTSEAVRHGCPQDTARRYIRPSPRSQCRSCHPRRMTPAEIERYGLPPLEGDDDA